MYLAWNIRWHLLRSTEIMRPCNELCCVTFPEKFCLGSWHWHFVTRLVCSVECHVLILCFFKCGLLLVSLNEGSMDHLLSQLNPLYSLGWIGARGHLRLKPRSLLNCGVRWLFDVNQLARAIRGRVLRSHASCRDFEQNEAIVVVFQGSWIIALHWPCSDGKIRDFRSWSLYLWIQLQNDAPRSHVQLKVCQITFWFSIFGSRFRSGRHFPELSNPRG